MYACMALELLTITAIAISIECETRVTETGIGSNGIFTALITLLYTSRTLINICRFSHIQIII